MFKNLLKMVLFLVTIGLLLTACGGGNENPQQGDSSNADAHSIPAQNTTIQAEIAPPESSGADGVYEPQLIGSSWMTLSHAGISIDVPNTWIYRLTDNGINMIVLSEDEGIHIQFGRVVDRDPQEFLDIHPSSPFIFNSGSVGYEVAHELGRIWLTPDLYMRYGMILSAASIVDAETDELILRIARSLTAALPNETGQGAVAVTQDGNLDSGFHDNWDQPFIRWEYLAFDTPSLEAVFRFPDQHMYNLMFLQNYEVFGFTFGERLVVAPRGTDGVMTAIVDISGISGIPNALHGDIVTVYGTFTGLSLGIPQIRASHVAFNNILPDPVEFLPVAIEVLNMYDDRVSLEHSGENEYLGNGRMNIVAYRVSYLAGRPTRVRRGWGPFWVDGYRVAFQHVDANGNLDPTAPFGLNTVFLDTVRFHSFYQSPFGTGERLILIRVVSESVD